MERRFSPSPQSKRDASPSNMWSVSSSDRQSDSSSSSSSVRDHEHTAMSNEWTDRSRQQGFLDKYAQRQRWSTYTADTSSSSTALESGNEESMLYSRHERKSSCDDSATLLDANERDDDEEAGSATPTSAEDKVTAALVSMLSTANNLLISTMTARSDLARLQIKESAMDEELDRREEAIMMEIENNGKMSKWMEEASEKLERILLETSSSSFYHRSKATSNAAWSRSGPSDARSHLWRAPSTTGQVNRMETDSPSGFFDAKDEVSIESKSAAKRLERVLQRASSSSNGIPIAQIKVETSHSKDRSSMSVSPRQIEKSDLATRLGMPSSSRHPDTTSTPDFLLAPDAIAATSTSTASACTSSLSDTSDHRTRSPSITSESGPSSVFSSREDNSASAIQVLLTPQTPYEEPPFLTTSPLSEESRHGLNKRSISSLRSPNPIISSRKMSAGPNVSEAALDRSNWQEEDGNVSSKRASQLLGNKGALEALRKLNGGSSFGQAATQSQSSGWSGTFASWVGMSSPSQ